jgi:hypothetical protein
MQKLSKADMDKVAALVAQLTGAKPQPKVKKGEIKGKVVQGDPAKDAHVLARSEYEGTECAVLWQRKADGTYFAVKGMSIAKALIFATLVGGAAKDGKLS